MSAETGRKRTTNLSSENSTYNIVFDALPDGPGIRPSRPSKKGIAFGKRSNSMKRNPNAVVTKMGWLYKQASSGVKQWNKRWFVLVDRCLFYYKDEKEEGILGSIPLLSFHISPVQPSDNISRKYAFKVTVCWVGDESLHNKAQMPRQAEHAGIRTYYFSAENKEEQDSWVHVMEETSQVQNPLTPRLERQDSENKPPARVKDPEIRSRGEGDGKGSEKMEQRSESSQLTKVNGSEASSERILDLDSSRHLPEGDHPPQPNGWSFAPSPFGPAGKAVLEGSGQWANLPRTHPERLAQRQNSMSQLQKWVNLRRAALPTEVMQSPNRYFPGLHHSTVPQYSSQYSDGYQHYTQAGSRPDSICSMSAFDRAIPQWTMEDRQQIFHRRPSYEPQDWKDSVVYGHPIELWTPRSALYYQEVDAACGSLQRLSLTPRCHSVPRSPSQEVYRTRQRVYSPVRSPSARFEPASRDAIFGDPAAYTMRCSISSPKYDYLGDRHPLPAGVYSYSYPASPPLHDKMVSPYADPYREVLQNYKFSEQDTDKLLSRLCEQHKLVREQDRLVQQLRAEKESLESALMGTHQEMEMFGNQTAFPDKLLHRKESLQNQLISIRVELSQATTALNNSSVEYDILEAEVSALHDALWEQLNLNLQNELMNRHIQREIWRIQDIMEGLRKNNPSRGTDTAKHRVVTGPSATFSTNSPASPLSSASLTSPLSPFSLISGSQGSPTKHTTSEVKLNFEPYKRESPHLLTSLPNEATSSLPLRTDVEHEKQWQLQQAANKVGIVPPRTKTLNDEALVTKQLVLRRGGDHGSNGQISRERPKSALFPIEVKSKMSVEEQIHRIKRHQSGSMKEKRRSLQLPSSQQTDGTIKPAGTYRVVRRHRSIHEVDISDLEAAIRSQEPQKMYESPREEIARLRKMELEPQAFSIDINRELSTPNKVLIPERYLDMELDSPLSPEELLEKKKKVERIKTLIAKSSLQNVIPLSDSELEMPSDPMSHLQEQEKLIELSCALATEASRRGRLLSALCASPSPPTSPTSPAPQTFLSSSEHSNPGGGSNGSDHAVEYGGNLMCV